MRALVTGSTGFLGSTLVAALNERGIEVLGLRRTTSPDTALAGLSITPVIGDILDPKSLPRAMENVNWVFHLAAVADHRRASVDALYRANVEGARHVFQAAKDAGVKRVIFTSSSAALGVPRSGKPLMDESDQFNLKPEEFPYGYSKHLAEQILQEYVEQGLDAVTVLPSAVLGPRDIKFIAGELIIQAIKGTVPAIPTGGLNYIDARDCIDGHIAAAEKGRCGERYLLATHNMSHREVMEIIAQELGTRVPRLDIPPWAVPLIGEVVGLLNWLGFDLPINREAVRMSRQHLYYDNHKAVSELGLRVRPFAESVRDTYTWYAKHGYLQRRGISPCGA